MEKLVEKYHMIGNYLCKMCKNFTLQSDEDIQAAQSITFPRRSTPANFIGLMTAKYLQILS